MKLRIKTVDKEIQERIMNNDVEFVEEDYDYIIKPHSNELINSYDGKSVVPLELKDIIFFESLGNEIYAKTETLRLRVRGKLYNYESYYSSGFIRISKSYIINRDHIRKIMPSINMKFMLIMSNKEKLVVTRSYYYRFKEEFNI